MFWHTGMIFNMKHRKDYTTQQFSFAMPGYRSRLRIQAQTCWWKLRSFATCHHIKRYKYCATWRSDESSVTDTSKSTLYMATKTVTVYMDEALAHPCAVLFTKQVVPIFEEKDTFDGSVSRRLLRCPLGWVSAKSESGWDCWMVCRNDNRKYYRVSRETAVGQHLATAECLVAQQVSHLEPGKSWLFPAPFRPAY